MAILRVRLTEIPTPKEVQVKHTLNLAHTVSEDKFFLTVLSQSDFELIVDEIWANMRDRPPGGWSTREQVRANLLSFMRSLPGN
jgi:hypothetical protein